MRFLSFKFGKTQEEYESEFKGLLRANFKRANSILESTGCKTRFRIENNDQNQINIFSYYFDNNEQISQDDNLEYTLKVERKNIVFDYIGRWAGSRPLGNYMTIKGFEKAVEQLNRHIMRRVLSQEDKAILTTQWGYDHNFK